MTSSTPSFDATTRGNSRWNLRVGSNNEAHLEYSAANPEFVRLAIGRMGTLVSYDLQLNLAFGHITRGERYAVGFLARSDSPRKVYVGVSRAQDPWSNLGFYAEVELLPDWQSFDRTIEATDDEDAVRVHFDAGGCATPIEVSAVSLRSLSDGRHLDSLAQDRIGGTPRDLRVGRIDFGALRRVQPIGREGGRDRGLPIDRQYVTDFLAAHRADIRGRVLEVGDNGFARRLGGDAVIDVNELRVVEDRPDPTAAFELPSVAALPDDSFDCIVLPQTLHFVFDLRAAIGQLIRILKRGGVVLATVPGMCPTSDVQQRGLWCWGFTEGSVSLLFAEAFPAANISVRAFGNALTSIAYLHGLAAEDLAAGEMRHHEPGYGLTIGVRASKAPAADAA